MEQKQFILVTNWDEVEADDFYLSDKWLREQDLKGEATKLRKLQKEGKLYVAYIVLALSYTIYYQMDADQVFINADMDVLVTCESAVINNSHEKRIEYDY